MTSNKTRTEQIRALNDKLRQELIGGIAVITPKAVALGEKTVENIFKAVAIFDEFCLANDPYQEHDFGALDVDGHRVLFKIEYYDTKFEWHSPDPADPDVTERVITIMLAEEY